MVRRTMAGWQSVLVRLAAVALALLLSSVLLVVLGRNPLEVYVAMLRGAFGTPYRIQEVVVKAIPLAVTSLGILIAFKMKFWNIGAEGQILMGAFGASAVAYFVPLGWWTLPLMAVSGMVCGGLWAMIPAFFKARFKTNETLFTLMQNYIALKWITYLQYGPWRDPNAKGFPTMPFFDDIARLPKLFGVHVGWVVALVLAGLVYLFFARTKKGYEIAVIGESERTGQYAGMNVGQVILLGVFFSGVLGGLTGMLQAAGVNHTLSVEITGNAGNTAIITAWLANLNPAAVLVVCVLFSVLTQGGEFIETAFAIPASAAQLLQGLILFCVLGSQFFIQYKLVWERRRLAKGADV